MRIGRNKVALSIVFAAFFVAAGVPAAAAGIVEQGTVTGAGQPIAGATVTLWAARGTAAPRKLAQSTTGSNGGFSIRGSRSAGDQVFYMLASGGHSRADVNSASNPAVMLISILGANPPSHVTVNELTTIASVWTNAQFLDGQALQGNPLGLRVAAGNVPNFVDLSTGGYGGAIQDSLNGPQTTTLANFGTLGSLFAACAARLQPDACSGLFSASTGPAGATPSNTLAAAESIARWNWYQPERLFALVDKFYPMPAGRNLRNTPFTPYLTFAPSAWVLALKFDGGGYRGGGKMMVDADGNVWAGDNFTVGSQAQDTLWQGNLSEFAPNGRPLSPNTTGFTGGGVEGVGFGGAIDTRGNVWVSSYGGASVSVFNNRGKPLTPPDGITFNHQLGLMQGIMVAPNGDVWVLGLSKNQLLYFPGGDWNKGRIVCQGREVEPCKSLAGPFHLVIDQQNRIWVGSLLAPSVTRFSASDPTKTEVFQTGGLSASGMAVDSRGNVWVTNRLKAPQGAAIMEKAVTTLKSGGNGDEVFVRAMADQTAGGGSVTVFKPDGTQYEGSPFTGPSLTGPWAFAIDGNDQVWISNFAHPWGQIAHLCGVRTETCPPGSKTGDPISPPLGYVGGGMQMLIDIDEDPAGDLWVSNNWQVIDPCFGTPLEALSTLCGGQGVTVFYGLAKPVRTPVIGWMRPL